jgi:hypothetical protein
LIIPLPQKPQSVPPLFTGKIKPFVSLSKIVAKGFLLLAFFLFAWPALSVRFMLGGVHP